VDFVDLAPGLVLACKDSIDTKAKIIHELLDVHTDRCLHGREIRAIVLSAAKVARYLGVGNSSVPARAYQPETILASLTGAHSITRSDITATPRYVVLVHRIVKSPHDEDFASAGYSQASSIISTPCPAPTAVTAA
jgi:hypothetical protein